MARQEAVTQHLHVMQKIQTMYEAISALTNQSAYLEELIGDLDSKIMHVESTQMQLNEISATLEIRHENRLPSIMPPQIEAKHTLRGKHELTVKDMVSAVLQGFPNGTTVQSLTEYIEQLFGTQVPRSTLSPTLSRMKQDNTVQLRGDRWYLSSSGQNQWDF